TLEEGYSLLRLVLEKQGYAVIIRSADILRVEAQGLLKLRHGFLDLASLEKLFTLCDIGIDDVPVGSSFASLLEKKGFLGRFVFFPGLFEGLSKHEMDLPVIGKQFCRATQFHNRLFKPSLPAQDDAQVT